MERLKKLKQEGHKLDVIKGVVKSEATFTKEGTLICIKFYLFTCSVYIYLYFIVYINFLVLLVLLIFNKIYIDDIIVKFAINSMIRF